MNHDRGVWGTGFVVVVVVPIPILPVLAVILVYTCMLSILFFFLEILTSSLENRFAFPHST